MIAEQLKLSLDVLTLVLGVIAAMQLFHSALGGKFGTAMSLILVGIIILAVNHAADTIYLNTALREAGHTTDYLQPAVVHRVINLLGFGFMTFGYLQFGKK